MDQRSARRRLVGAGVALAVAAVAAVVVFTQVEVGTGAASRSCGSAFDAIVDRSGWETWWAADLGDPDASIRSELLRTRECPGAVNTRTAIGAGLAALSVVGAAWVTFDGRRRRGPAHAEHDVGDRLARLGRVTAGAGVGLTLAGVIATIVLVADADSTLFLYTDRLVVGVVALIVLVPPMALIVIGRVLSILSTRPDLGDDDADDA